MITLKSQMKEQPLLIHASSHGYDHQDKRASGEKWTSRLPVCRVAQREQAAALRLLVAGIRELNVAKRNSFECPIPLFEMRCISWRLIRSKDIDATARY
jgi:hypothetical protein